MTDPKPLPNTERDTKPWAPERPFQRVKSPSFTPAGAVDAKRLDGDGHPRGTRRFEDAPFIIPGLKGTLDDVINFKVFEKGLRMTPNWVRTVGPLAHSSAGERVGEHELYGFLLRSFQTWTDVPGFQWHRWYDWNFHVQPAPEFDWLRGKANLIELGKPKTDPTEPPLEQFVEGSLECEWDAGSIGPKPGPMFSDLKQGTKSGWIWPMAGDWVWIVGRSIYDGGHEFRRKEGGVEVGPRLCRSELHPCKAMATVRTAAVPLGGSKHRVPVTQFAFFASALGGYMDFDTLAPLDDDYEFLVDLPLMPDDFQPLTHDIGRTPEFPLNRLVLRRPEAIAEFDFVPYQNAFGALSVGTLREKFKPEVSFETPDPAKPEQVQARIRIPLKKLAAQTKAKSYGVIVNLGWPDPYKNQGKKVKRCLLTFKRIHPVTGVEGTGEWRMKLAVNGRWFHLEQNGIKDESKPAKTTDITALPAPIEMFLPDHETVRVHAHIWELNLMDDVYQRKDPDRTVRFNRIQIFAEAIRSGEDPGDVLEGDTLSDLGSFVAALPLAVLELIESIPLIGPVVQFIELILSLIPGKPSPTNLLGKIGEQPADWRKHIDRQPPKPEPKGSHVVQRVVARNAILMMSDSLTIENGPVAVIDAGHGFSDENKKNPLPLDKNGKTEVKLSAVAMREDSDLAELFEFVRSTPTASTFPRKFIRYELEYDVEVSDQDLS
ncbi:MAG: hypothetical protein ACOY0T_11590 [Myxococcota bacterium]